MAKAKNFEWSNEIMKPDIAVASPEEAASSQAGSDGAVTNNQEKAENQPSAPSISHLPTDESEDEPKIHARTWVAVAAMFVVNFTALLALNGPPTVLSYLGEQLNNPANQTWIQNAISLVQAIIGPFLSSISDVFQARKYMLVGCAIMSFVGCAIAPGATNIYRVIGAQIMIGFGFASIPLGLSVPSEILPRRWRPQALAIMNVAASLGASVGPLAIGALTRDDAEHGWRNFYWMQMTLWGVAAVGVLVGYKPPKRHTLLDHLSFWTKLGHIDIIGGCLMTAGLTLFLAALNLGGVTYPWSSVQVLVPLLLGTALSAAFGLYEWKGTRTGILHHGLFEIVTPYRRTLILCIALIMVESAVLFAYVIFYPIMTTELFETDPFLVAVRLIPFWLACGASTVVFGHVSTRFRTIKYPLVVSYLISAAGMAGFATIQPGDNWNAIAFAVVSGIGFGGPLVLVFTGVQLSIPHSLLATATAVTTSARALAATVFTAIYSAIVSSRLGEYIPKYVAEAAMSSGLPPSSLGPFIEGLTGGAETQSTLTSIAGANETIIQAAEAMLKQAYADGLRDVYIIAAGVGALGFLMCFFVGDLTKTMNYHVDATVEKSCSQDREDIETPLQQVMTRS